MVPAVARSAESGTTFFFNKPCKDRVPITPVFIP